MKNKNLKDKILVGLIAIIAVGLMSGCIGEIPTESVGEIKTSKGTLVITDVQLGDRFPPNCSRGPTCNVAKAGHQTLAVLVEAKKGDDLGDMVGEIFMYVADGFHDAYVIGNDSHKAELAVVAIVDSDSPCWALVFAPRKSAHDFKLIWPDNEPIDLEK